MQELAKQMGDKGKIAILAGNQNAPNLQKRVQGVKEEAKKHPGITILNTFYHAETPQDAAAEVVRAQNAYPDIQGWAMIGGWALFTPALLTDLDPNKVKIVSVDALPVELPYVDKGLAPVLFAQPTYLWGYVSVKTIFDHVYLQQGRPGARADGSGPRVEGQPRRVGAPAEDLGLHRRGPEVPVDEVAIARAGRSRRSLRGYFRTTYIATECAATLADTTPSAVRSACAHTSRSRCWPARKPISGIVAEMVAVASPRLRSTTARSPFDMGLIHTCVTLSPFNL